jgi:hypothetical protein
MSRLFITAIFLLFSTPAFARGGGGSCGENCQALFTGAIVLTSTCGIIYCACTAWETKTTQQLKSSLVFGAIWTFVLGLFIWWNPKYALGSAAATALVGALIVWAVNFSSKRRY